MPPLSRVDVRSCAWQSAKLVGGLFAFFAVLTLLDIVAGAGSSGVLFAIGVTPIEPGVYLGMAILRPGIDDTAGFAAGLALGALFNFVLYTAAIYAIRRYRGRTRSNLG